MSWTYIYGTSLKVYFFHCLQGERLARELVDIEADFEKVVMFLMEETSKDRHRLETTYREQLTQAEQRETDLRSRVAFLEGGRANFISAERSERAELNLELQRSCNEDTAEDHRGAADQLDNAGRSGPLWPERTSRCPPRPQGSARPSS